MTQNGRGDVWKWICGLLATALVTGATMVLREDVKGRATNARVDALNESMRELNETISGITTLMALCGCSEEEIQRQLEEQRRGR